MNKKKKLVFVYLEMTQVDFEFEKKKNNFNKKVCREELYCWICHVTRLQLFSKFIYKNIDICLRGEASQGLKGWPTNST